MRLTEIIKKNKWITNKNNPLHFKMVLWILFSFWRSVCGPVLTSSLKQSSCLKGTEHNWSLSQVLSPRLCCSLHEEQTPEQQPLANVERGTLRYTYNKNTETKESLMSQIACGGWTQNSLLKKTAQDPTQAKDKQDINFYHLVLVWRQLTVSWWP